MTPDELVPCYVSTLFMRGSDYASSDGSLCRVQMLSQLHDRIAELDKAELIPYLGALILHSLAQFNAGRDHWGDANAILLRIIRNLTDEQHSMSHEIFNEWRQCCPRGYVLLPIQIHSALLQLQRKCWISEIEDFAATQFTQKHLEVAAH